MRLVRVLMAGHPMRNRPRKPIFHVALVHMFGYYGLLLLLAIPFGLPFIWLLITAFTPAPQIYAGTTGVLWLPQPVTIDNFTKGWALLDFPRFLGNSVLVTGLTVIGTVISSSVVGFAFATIPARGKQWLFALLLTTIMLPPTVTLLPRFLLFSQLGWINTHLPLTVPPFFANAFYVFLFRQFFLGLPKELFESADIDGCHPFAAYRWIGLPLARAALITVAVFAFIGSWNDFLEPLVYLSSNHKFTLSLGLLLFHGLFYTQLHYLIPMALVALLPVLLLFFITQRYIVQGIADTGLKG